MPQTETEELHNRLDNLKKTNSKSKQVDLQDRSDFIQKNINTGGSSQIEKPMKGRGLRFFDSLMGSGAFIKKDIKNTMIGVGVGFALAMLFPPVGIAIMAISTIVGATAIGTKLIHHSNTKVENKYPKERTETRTEILSNIIKELMGKKFSKEKQQENKNGIKEDFKQNTETSTGETRRKIEDNIGNVIKNGGTNSREVIKSIVNTNRSKLAAFTNPLNSLTPNIKQDNIVSKPKVQKKGIQVVNKIWK